MNWRSLTRTAAVPAIDDDRDDDGVSRQSIDAGYLEAREPSASASNRHWSHRLGANAADRVYTAFDVSQPVDDPAELHGREPQVAQLVSGVLYRRNHGFIAGLRGSGKTSLVRSFGQSVDREGIVVLYSACDNGTTLGDLMRGYLEQIPASSLEAGTYEAFQQRVAALPTDCTPNQATSLFAMIQYSQAIVISDEFDRVTNEGLRWKVASLLKLVSDARLPVRFVLVGDSSTFADILVAHPSLTRHVTRVSVDPLSNEAITELLHDCADRCSMRFSEGGLDVIADVACGSPYHARLFGLHAALAAVEDDSDIIETAHATLGLQSAFQEWSSLNPADGAAMMSIARGAHGNPDHFMSFARLVAGRSSATQYRNKGNTPVSPEMFAAFGSSVEPAGGELNFRDPTAPQFLIALGRVGRRTTNSPAEAVNLDA